MMLREKGRRAKNEVALRRQNTVYFRYELLWACRIIQHLGAEDEVKAFVFEGYAFADADDIDQAFKLRIEGDVKGGYRAQQCFIRANPPAEIQNRQSAFG